MSTDLATLLIENEIISRQSHNNALAADTPSCLVVRLVEEGADPEQIACLLEQTYGERVSAFALAAADRTLIPRLPAKLAHALGVLPLRLTKAHVEVAMADPTNAHAVGELARAFDTTVKPRVAHANELRAALRVVYPGWELAPAPIPLTRTRSEQEEVELTSAEFEMVDSAAPRLDDDLTEELDDDLTEELDDDLTEELDDDLTAELDDDLTEERDDDLTAELDDDLTGELDDDLTEERDDDLTEERDDDLTADPDDRTGNEEGSKDGDPSNALLEQDPPRPPERRFRRPAPIEDSWASVVHERSLPTAAHVDLGPFLAELRVATDRDAIVNAACAATLVCARCAVFLTHSRGVLRGWDARGEGVSRDAIRHLWIPVSSPSIFTKVVETHTAYRGEYGSSAADHIYRAAIGSRGGTLEIHPITVRGALVALLCADDPKTRELETLNILAHAVGEALVRILS